MISDIPTAHAEQWLLARAHHAYETALREDFSCFLQACVQTISPAETYMHNWHIDLMAEYLSAVERRECTRLIINIPPRHLKSMTVSVAWPAFLLGHHPSMRILTASYAHGLAIKHALDCRRVLQSEWYHQIFPKTILARDQNEKHQYATTARGHRRATSVGASLIGEGGDVLIVDDPMNAARAQSRLQREMTNQWFEQSFATRLNDKKRGAIVLVMQRLHPDDLTGFLLQKGGWEQLSLPAIAPARQFFSAGHLQYWREDGEALHSAREDISTLERLKQELGSATFAAQYQQAPTAVDGQMFEPRWFGRYAQSPDAPDEIIQSWDTAIKASQQHDASVCATFALKEGQAFVLEMAVMKLEYPALKRAVVQQAARWNPTRILMEDKASGQSLLQDLRREGALPLLGVMPKGDKVLRAARVSPLVEAGKVWLPKTAHWLADFEMEIAAFPHGTHDDQVDAFTQALDYWKQATLRAKPIMRRI